MSLKKSVFSPRITKHSDFRINAADVSVVLSFLIPGKLQCGLMIRQGQPFVLIAAWIPLSPKPPVIRLPASFYKECRNIISEIQA